MSKIVSEVSEERITAALKKLQGFGTRNLRSSQDDPNRGIGAGRKWIYEQFHSYRPRLEVSYDHYRVKKDPSRGSRIPQDLDVYNVVAVLPGTINREQRIVIGAHYDSVNRTGTPRGQPGDPPSPVRDPNIDAAGVTDDGSGVACVMELARVMSQYMLNNDMIGNDVGGSGRTENRKVNVFSEGPMDWPSGEIARYVKEIGERYIPSMTVNPVFRADRFGRDGDQRSFYLQGFGAVRFSTPVENFANQHSASDTFDGASPGFITRVTRVNGAVAASLAWAPKSPDTSVSVEHNGRKMNILLLTRGKSGYDALLKWEKSESGTGSGGIRRADAQDDGSVLGA